MLQWDKLKRNKSLVNTDGVFNAKAYNLLTIENKSKGFILCVTKIDCVAKMKKGFILFILCAILIITPTTANALLISEDGTFDCSGKLTYSNNFYMVSNAYNTSKHFLFVQATVVGYPEPNVFLVDNDCNPISNTTIDISTYGASSFSGDGYTDYSYYYTRWSGSGNDVIIKTSTDFSTTTAFTLNNVYSNAGMIIEGDVIYILMENSTVHKYSTNGVYLGSQESGLSGIGQLSGLERISDYTLLTRNSTHFIEFTDDFSTIYATNITSIPSNYYFSSSFDDSNSTFLIYDKSGSTSEKYYTITDVYDLNYFIIDSTNYSKQLCVDSNYYCQNTSYSFDDQGELFFYCPSTTNTTYCSDECINTLSGNIISGVCTQLGCTNECNQEGFKRCSTPTAYQECGFYDGDACLEYGINLYCTSGEYCEFNPISGASCVALTSTGTYTQNWQSTDLELVSTSGTITQEGSSLSTYEKISNFVSEYAITIFSSPAIARRLPSFEAQTQLNKLDTSYKFSTYLGVTPQNYFAYDCDYEETTNFEDDINTVSGITGTYTHNTSTTYSFVNTTSSLTKSFNPFDNQRLEITIKFDETGNYNVLFNTDSDLLENLSFYYNKTSYELVIREITNNVTLYNFTGTSDNLEEIYIFSTFITDIQTINTEINIVRLISGERTYEYIYSLPLLYRMGTNPNNVVILSNGKDIKLYQVRGVYSNDFPVFTYNNETYKTFDCDYEQSKSHNIRVWGNYQGIPTYYFNDDYVANVGIGGELVVSDDTFELDRSLLEELFAGENGWNLKTKLLIATITLFVIFSIFAFISITTKESFPMILGAILCGVALLYFAIEGFIPVWVIAIFGLIGGFIGVAIIRNTMIGKGG